MTDSSPIRILGFAGSLRQKSFNRSLLREAVENAPAGVVIETFDLVSIPLYNADVEAQGFPPGVRDFRERIAAADALLIAAPEYNFSIPGVLKNAIDWASSGPETPLPGKPVALMGASAMTTGTVLSQHHLRQVLLANAMHTLVRPLLYVGSARTKFDAESRLTDEDTRARVIKVVEALAKWTRQLKAGASSTE